MPWVRNSQPIVGMERYPDDHRSRCRTADTTSRAAAIARMTVAADRHGSAAVIQAFTRLLADRPVADVRVGAISVAIAAR